MGNKICSPIQGNLESIHNQLMTHAGADYDIATATTLSYDQFLTYITKLNRICSNYKDPEGRILVFAVKKGTDQSVFWRATVKIACVNYNTVSKTIESHRLLNIRQFLQAFRRISYECTNGSFGISSTPDEGGAHGPIPASLAAVMEHPLDSPSTGARGPSQLDSNQGNASCRTNLDECIICLENKPDVILPCTHAYCLPCIEQWWEYCDNTYNDECSLARIHVELNVKDKSCPVCRESLKSTDDTWVLSEAPDDLEVCEEIQKSLISIAKNDTRGCSNSAAFQDSHPIDL